MITWIHGNTGAGKTTLAKQMQAKQGGILLDGDAMRTCWAIGFSKADRWEHNLRVSRIAKVLACQGFNVIVSTICPYRELRETIKQQIGCKFIELLGGKDNCAEFPYECNI